MKNSPLISIIVPIYKVEKYLDKCINSIINQTYYNLEIILVDDGSPDNCPKICDKWAKKDSRIKVIHKKNGGLSDARNIGIKESNGKLLYFVDSDDYINNETISILYDNINKLKADISTCKYIKIDERDSINLIKTNNFEEISKKDALSDLLMDGRFNNYSWNKLYKKELFNGVLFPLNRKFEDIGTTYKVLLNAKKIAYSDYIGYYYVQHEGSILSTINEKLIIDYMLMSEILIDELKKNKLVDKRNLDIAYIKYIIQFHMMCIKSKNTSIYYSKELIEKYNDMIKIVKKYGYYNVLKKLSYKQKIMMIILHINRNVLLRGKK